MTRTERIEREKLIANALKGTNFVVIPSKEEKAPAVTETQNFLNPVMQVTKKEAISILQLNYRIPGSRKSMNEAW